MAIEGFTNEPVLCYTTIEHVIEKVLKKLQWQILLLYLTDMIVFSKDFKSHVEQLAEMC